MPKALALFGRVQRPVRIIAGLAVVVSWTLNVADVRQLGVSWMTWGTIALAILALVTAVWNFQVETVVMEQHRVLKEQSKALDEAREMVKTLSNHHDEHGKTMDRLDQKLDALHMRLDVNRLTAVTDRIVKRRRWWRE